MRYLLSLIFLISLFSCNSDSFETETRTVFRYNESAGITSLDPAFARNQANIWACNQIFNGLIQLNDELEVEACIAKQWSVSEDGLVYTFILRDDVYFHKHEAFNSDNGRKVIASDFYYSFHRLANEQTASPGAWVFNNVEFENGKHSFKAVNDTVFQIILESPFPPFLSLLSMQYCSVIPKEVVELYGKDFRKHPIGTGPFKFKMWKEGLKLIFVKNDSYFEKERDEQLPHLDAVAISFIIDKQAAFIEFVKGNLDFMSGIDASYKDELLTRDGELNPKYTKKFNLITQPYLNTEYLGILMDTNLTLIKDSPLRIKKIRQAINYGFDRDKMMRYLRNNIGTPGIYGFIPVGMPSFDTSGMTPYIYNPDRSRKLLNEAGYPDGEGLPEIKLATNASYLDLCTYIQSELSEIGMDIKLEVNPPATLRELIAQSKSEFFRGSWIADYPDAENYLSLFYSPNFCPRGPNYTHFSNTEYDRMYESAGREVNDSVRYSIYHEMDKLIMEEAPVVVLYYDQVLRFTQKYIKGIGSNPMNLLTLKRVRKTLLN